MSKNSKNSIKIFSLLIVILVSFYSIPDVYSSIITKTDSLKKILDSAPDSNKAVIFNALSKEVLSDSLELSYEYANSALVYAKDNNMKYEEADALLNLAEVSYFLNEMDNALDYFKQSLMIFIELQDSVSVLNDSNLDSVDNKNTENIKVLESFLKLLESKKVIKYDKNISVLLFSIGNIYDDLGKSKMSLEYYFHALQIYEKNNDEKYISIVSNNIGNLYLTWGNHEKALFNYLKSLKIEEKLKSKSGIAVALNNIGIIYHDWKNYDKALYYYEQALIIEEELNNQQGIAESLNNIAIIYDETTKYDEAIGLYKRSLEIEKAIGNKSGTSLSLSNIGEFYEDRGDYKKAFDYYFKSIKIDKEINNSIGLGQTYSQLGNIYVKLKQYNKAIKYYNRSREIVEPLYISETIIENYKGLGDVYSKINNYKKAIYFINKYHHLKDSIFSKETLNKQNNLQAAFEIEKREKEIKLLNSEKKIRALEISEKQQQLNRNKKLLLISFGGLILFVVFIVLLFRSIRRKNKAVKLLNIQNKEIKENRKNLIAAKEKAEESDKLKSSFLSIISHELRTPLNAIIGFSELVNKDIPINTIVEYVKMINLSGYNLLEIIDDILYITDIESGRFEISKSKFLVLSVFDEIDKEVKSFLEKENKNHLEFKLNISVDSKNLMIYSNKRKIRKVLTQLIKNAIKFTENGSVEYGFAKKNDEIIFFVKDTGVGIPSGKSEIIFDKFRQADESNTRKYGGLGLGLSYVKKIIMLLNGKIWFDSVEDKGTTFYFSLPIIAEKIKSASVKRKLGNILVGKTVLVAEDNDLNYLLVEKILEFEKINIIRAKSGKEVVEKFKSNKEIIDLVLMDIKMPNMNGLEATTKIRKISNIPIIAISAYMHSTDKINASISGCNEFIEKPIKRAELVKKMQSLLMPD